MMDHAVLPSQERDFHHPFQPYDIQNQFMGAVYECLENGRVGIFESPTGTGKSLSLICGSMTWLRDFKRRLFDENTIDDPNRAEDEPEWMLENAKRQRQQTAMRCREEQEARLKAIRDKEQRSRGRFESGEPPQKRQKVSSDPKLSDEDQESEFLLVDYESEDERVSAGTTKQSSFSGLSTATQALMEKLGMNISTSQENAEPEIDDPIKIFFCSRTHSQLSQFAHEMRRVRMPPSIKISDDDQRHHGAESNEDLKHVTLGSRKQLCINSKVNKLGSSTGVNERCLELQQSGTPIESKCKYLPNKENEVLVNDFRDHTLAQIRDIEDFGKLGKQIGICPYYASRAAMRPTEVVTLPYPLLLQKSARDALKISLKNHIVIIDEAHNLMDAITNIHSVTISLSQLIQSRAQLGVYLQKFRNKLKGKNRAYVTQLVRIIDSLVSCLQTRKPSKLTESQVKISELVSGKGVDQINLYKLMNYLQESRLARKVEGYIVHADQKSAQPPTKSSKTTSKMPPNRLSSTPALTHVQSFLSALTNPAAEGRFFFTKAAGPQCLEEEMYLKYRLLDPTHHFKEIVDDARAVILAGGTMSPMSDYTDHLFQYLPSEQIQTLSCGHIIPPSNLLVLPVSKGPNGTDFEFTFEKRNSENIIADLGDTILSLSRTVPDGLVVFFPSYAYLDKVVQSWQTGEHAGSHSIKSLWTQMSAQKRIFLEPKSSSSSSAPPVPAAVEEASPKQHEDPNYSSAAGASDKVLAAYTAHIQSIESTGALLFAVIGGSLSEGINFSDKLGRGIVVVGLPFPNAQSAEWKAKMEFMAQRSTGDKGTSSANGDTAREYYENACMRAVNQSVGRAIRHKDDYATIVLLDRRYERGNIRGKLPAWIRRSLAGGMGFVDAIGAVDGFFKGKRGS